MRKSASIVVLGCSAILLVAGCATSVTIRSVKPAPYHLGMSSEVSLIEVDGGRRNQQDAVAEQLIAQSRSAGFFNIKNRVGEGIRFEIQDGSPVSMGKEIDTVEKRKSDDLELKDK